MTALRYDVTRTVTALRDDNNRDATALLAPRKRVFILTKRAMEAERRASGTMPDTRAEALGSSGPEPSVEAAGMLDVATVLQRAVAWIARAMAPLAASKRETLKSWVPLAGWLSSESSP